MKLDLLTIVAFIAAAEIALGCFTIFAVWSSRGDISGSKWWGIITVLQGAAFAGYLFTGGMLPEWSRFALPILLALTFWGFAEVIAHFLGVMRMRRFYSVTTLILILWQYTSVFHFHNETLRLVGISLVLSANSAALYYLTSADKGPQSRGRRLLTYIYLALSVVLLVRASFFAGIFTGIPGFAGFRLAFESIYFFYLSITLTSSTFAYLIMCNDHYVAGKITAETARHTAEQDFAVIRDNLPQMAWMIKSGGEFAWLNKAWYDFTGADRKTSPEQAYLSAVHPEDVKKIRARMSEALNNRTSYYAEFRMKRSDGVYRWILETAVPASLDAGGLVGSALDITDRRDYVSQIEELSRELIRIEEKERAEIAGELHDSVASDLTVALLTAKNRLSRALGESAVEIESIMTPIRRAISTVRLISHRLSPLSLESVGLNMAIEDLLDRINETGKFKVEAQLNNLESAFPEGWNLNLYRIVQECLSNVLKHSTGRSLSVICERRGEYTILNIRNDGSVASDTQHSKGGLGLLLMRQRASTFGGQVETLHLNPGFLVRIVIPPQLHNTGT